MFAAAACPFCKSVRVGPDSKVLVKYGCGTRVVQAGDGSRTLRGIECLRHSRTVKKAARPRRAAKPALTHADLVASAARWLASRKRCSVVATELVTSAAESADALGFRNSLSVLVECKTSASDFAADAKKSFRVLPDKGMCAYRYYLVPAELVEHVAARLPAGWGLLSADSAGRVSGVSEGRLFRNHNRRAETATLVSLVRRLGVAGGKGVSVKIYTHTTTNKATVSVAVEETHKEKEVQDDRQELGI
jgi:hypothetical protein